MENKQTEIEQAKAILEQYGYYVENLWHVEDVKSMAENDNMSDSEAQKILHLALTSEYLTNEIWFSIDYQLKNR